MTDNQLVSPFDGATNINLTADGLWVDGTITSTSGAANGQSVTMGVLTEELVIDATADSTTAIQIPANSQVTAVSVRVTVIIPTAATFDVGVVGTTTRYGTGIAVAAGTTNPGTNDGVRFYGSSEPIVITPNLQPGDATGRVRVTIHYTTVTPPTS